MKKTTTIGKEYGIIYSTMEYDKFRFLEGNRELRQSNVGKLRESMIEQQLVIPICVNENFEIIDGQHRFTVCKELGKPVYYYIQEGYGLSEVERANRSNTNWCLNDFLHSFVLKNNEHYKRIDDICNEYNVLASDVLRVLAKIERKQQCEMQAIFKEEKLIVTDEKYDALIKFFDALTLFEVFPLYTKTKFITAYSELYFYAEYDHEFMTEKYSKYGSVLKHCTTKDEYLDILCNRIYSARRRSDKNIYFHPQRKVLYR